MIWRKPPKTPIWIKNTKTNLYEPIPYDKMIQYPNGQWGITSLHRCMDSQMLDFITNHIDHFEYRHGTGTWLFKPQGTKINRLVMIARYATAGIVCTCLVTSIANIMLGEYLWAIPGIMGIGTLITIGFGLKQR